MTQNWKDIPRETKDKARPILSEVMCGTNKKSPQGMLRALLTQMNPNSKTWHMQFEITLKQKCLRTASDKECFFNKSTKLKRPKNIWQRLDTGIIAGGFLEGQIFGQGKQFTHDICAYCKREIFKAKTLLQPFKTET